MNANTGKYKHYLITRFNLYFADWKKYKNSNFFRSEQWMEHRIQLFDRYCFPSIKNQTSKRFKWLILVDYDTKGEFIKHIARYKEAFGNLEIIFTTGDNHISDTQKYITEEAECDYLITTRIDNDDAYHRDAIEIIHNNFAKQEFEFLNFQRGYQYVTRNQRLYLKEDLSSPFTTLIEKKKDAFKTVLFEQHQIVNNKWDVRQIRDGRYWLQVIHDKNVVNACSIGLAGWLKHYFLAILDSPGKLPAVLRSSFRAREILKDFNIRV